MTSNRASRLREPASEANRLDRALRLYRRRIARCRTENRVNRIHIALANYMTPAEVRYCAAALAGDAAESPSRRWIAALEGSMPIKKVRPVEFARRELLKGVTLYTADAGATSEKTLVIGFSGMAHRLMAPTSWLLSCLNPMLYDVIILRDFSRRAFAFGIPGLGGDLFQALSGLNAHVDPRAYRNGLSLGTSSGGVPAILAAIRLNLQRGIALSPQDFRGFAARLKALGMDDGPFAALLASRPHPFPTMILACGAAMKDDLAAAVALQRLVPSQLCKLKNCAQHGVLGWHIARGTLPAFLAKVMGQSLENHEPWAAGLTAKWIVGGSSGPRLQTQGP